MGYFIPAQTAAALAYTIPANSIHHRHSHHADKAAEKLCYLIRFKFTNYLYIKKDISVLKIVNLSKSAALFADFTYFVLYERKTRQASSLYKKEFCPLPISATVPLILHFADEIFPNRNFFVIIRLSFNHKQCE